MLRTKRDIDKHISEILSKITNEEDRHLRGFAIAKLYMRVKDYVDAKRFLASFLSYQEQNASAHKLMGQIQENLGQLEKAVKSYKRSLELDANQKDLVLKVCELYGAIQVDPERARYWADRAEKFYPHHDVVFKLREKIINADGMQNVEELEHLISMELCSRPKDVLLRIKLLRLYLDTERIKEAYDHAVEVEQKEPYPDSLEWYSFLVDIFQAYLEDNKECEMSFYMNLLNAYDRLVALNLSEIDSNSNKENQSAFMCSHSIADCANVLHEFDQCFFKVKKYGIESTVWDIFLTHIEGQLYMYAAILILKRFKKDRDNWKETSIIVSAYLLASYNCKPADLHASWFSLANETKKNCYLRWYKAACFRLSQSGHLLLNLMKVDRSKWLSRIEQVDKEKLFQTVFTMRDHRQTSSSSYLRNMSILDNMTFKIPSLESLHEYDSVAHLYRPNSLHHLLWLCLHLHSPKNKFQPDYGWKIFDGLQFNVVNYLNASPETLCQLDIQAFLYATIFERVSWLDYQSTILCSDYCRPTMLPALISDSLCTPEQAVWWSTAYSLFNNTAKKNLSIKRRILQQGLETVRLINNHGMDISMVVHIARSFAEQAKKKRMEAGSKLDFAVEISHLETQANHYWSKALEILETFSLNQVVRTPQYCLFRSHHSAPSSAEIKTMQEEGQYFMACRAMETEDYQKAVQLFSNLKTPFASYYEAVIFRKLADEELDQKPKECITSEMRSQHIILLTKARDAFYDTLDRLRGERKHPLNKVLVAEIENIDSRLNRIDPDTAVHFGEKDDFESVSVSDFEHDHGSRTNEKPCLRLLHPISTPRNIGKHKESPMIQDLQLAGSLASEYFPPSPERLDAQIQSLAFSQDAIVHCIMEQNKTLLDANKAILEELRENKNGIEQLKNQVEAFQTQTTANFASISKLNMINGACVSNKHPEMVYNKDSYNDYTADCYEDDEDYDHDCNNFSSHDSHLPQDYPYGQITGLHGTSTLTYAPSHQNQNTDIYYSSMQCTPPVISTMNYNVTTTPHQSSLGLHFSEGQKLPEFNFPALTESHADVHLFSKNNVFPRIGPQTNNLISVDICSRSSKPNSVLMQATSPTSAGPANVTITTGGFKLSNQIQPIFVHKLDNSELTQSPVTAPLQSTNEDNFSPDSKSRPHAFQITLPPTAITTAIPAFLMTAENTVITSTPSSAGTDTTHFTKTTSAEKCHLFRLSRFETQEEVVGNEGDYSGSDFKPLVPLPDEVDIKTGEEEEEIIFKDHAKLFRLMEKEWKERGTGIIKILRNSKTNQVRILMRRDQTLKICANHYILSDIKLEVKENVSHAWIWYALDFADGESKYEQFCIKFKTDEQSKNFKENFEKAKILSKTKSKEIVKESKEIIIESEQGAKTLVKLDVCTGQSSQEIIKSENKTDSKPQYGGFTFITTPKVFPPSSSENKISPVKLRKCSPKAATLEKPSIESDSVTKNSPFAKFTFTISKAQYNNNAGIDKKEFSSNVTNLSFADLLKETNKSAFQKSSTFQGFTNVGEHVFLNTSGIHNESTGKEDSEEYEPTVDFKPVISLPDLVELKSGEEDELKLFGQRAKLFRFDNETTQWKERGVGELKIMQHKVNNRFRIVMRREQVLKVCANHYMTAGMKLVPTLNSDRAYSWHANDYSEGELKLEKFAAKFKTHELTEDFKSAFENCLSKIKEDNLTCKQVIENISESDRSMSSILQNDSIVTTSAATISDSPVKLSLAGLFKIPVGSWECSVCLVRNNSSQTSCLVCQSPKPDVEIKPSDNITDDNLSLSQLFKSSAGSWECVECYVRNDSDKTICIACSTPKVSAENIHTSAESTGFCFTQNKTVNEENKTSGFNLSHLKSNLPLLESNKATGFSLSDLKSLNITNSNSSGFTFGSSSSLLSNTTNPSGFVFNNTSDDTNFSSTTSSLFTSTITTTTSTSSVTTFTSVVTPSSSSEFKFGSPALFTFTFSGKPLSSISSNSHSIKSPNTSRNEDDFYVEKDGEGEHIHFEPVIPLPDKIEVKTGEENENILYCHRAKLYRFANGEWKERGIGDVKILQQKETMRIRLLMRREPVMKLCLNHYMTPDIVLHSHNEKSWLWHAFDFSDGCEGQHEKFSIRFNNAEIAKEFQTAFHNAQKLIGHESHVNIVRSSEQCIEDTDITIIYESKPTHEQEVKADIYKLPKTFYLYEQAPQCPGCRGCDDRIPEILNRKEDIHIVLETEPSEEQKSLAEKYKLPSTFFLYEQKSPCPGCRGCESNHDYESSDKKLFDISKTVIDKSDIKNEDFNFESSPVCNFSFADLAQKNAGASSFLHTQETSKSFAFSGQGRRLFSSEVIQGGDDNNITSSDIHFEPVIPLPELIEVRTGEEDETIMFCHRARLYRFDADAKQWKERGIGEMKILKNEDSGKVRILMRREQVYKLACNHVLQSSMKLTAHGETAWCWYALDFAEGKTKSEQFSVKFKTKEIAEEFKMIFQECQKSLDNVHSSSETITKPDNVLSSNKSKDTKENIIVQENTDEETVVLFDKRAQLVIKSDKVQEECKKNLGDLKILLDDESAGARIIMVTDSSEILCNHVICMESSLKDNKKTCEWSATQETLKHYQAYFSSVNAVKDFKKAFEEGKKLAEAAKISDPNLENLIKVTKSIKTYKNKEMEKLHTDDHSQKRSDENTHDNK